MHRNAVAGPRANRRFTLVAVLSLGIGIGANVGTFSVIRALLLTPIASRRAGSLRAAPRRSIH